MALKIIKEIETEKGLTSEAYVRISGYFITKYAGLSLAIEVFKSQADLTGLTTAVEINNVISKSTEIGQNIYSNPFDITTLDNINISTYSYSKLKEHLVTLFGAENILDC
jgi:hypothetical protein